MERNVQGELGKFAEILDSLSDSSENLVVSKDGSVSPAEVSSGCAISYVNCSTKQTEIVTLKKGETFFYGDWDGTRCVRKSYTC